MILSLIPLAKCFHVNVLVLPGSSTEFQVWCLGKNCPKEDKKALRQGQLTQWPEKLCRHFVGFAYQTEQNSIILQKTRFSLSFTAYIVIFYCQNHEHGKIYFQFILLSGASTEKWPERKNSPSLNNKPSCLAPNVHHWVNSLKYVLAQF